MPLEPEVLTALRAELPAVAARTVQAVTAGVPAYAEAFTGVMGATITRAVELALATFLRLAGGAADDQSLLAPAVDAAYALGRGEARSGRSVDALLAAYRAGVRSAWRDWSVTAVAARTPAQAVADFAELVFAYIDQLSAASVAGHSDELAVAGRVREQYRERLAAALVRGDADLAVLCERADWAPPEVLTAVSVPASQARRVLAVLDARSLQADGEQLGLPGLALLLAVAPTRAWLQRTLASVPGTLGPTRPWDRVADSCARVASACRVLPGPTALLDTEAHLAALVATADPAALADLRAAVLAPLQGEPAQERLAQTLLSWLLHGGRREAVAADLHVHPQTVRYRMAQVRERYGDRLLDPGFVRDAVVALSAPLPSAP